MAGRTEVKYTLKSLEKLRVKDLRDLAREHKLIGYSQLRKTDLVSRLHRHLAKLARADKAVKTRRGKGILPALEAALHPKGDAPSSPVAEKAEPIETPTPQVEDPGAMRDPSWYAPELPRGYGIDRLTLMVRDPHWLYCYWELSPVVFEEARAELSGASWTVLRVHLLDDANDIVDGWEYGVGPDSTNWYVNTGRPGARFRAELGLRDAEGHYRRLVASNTVSAPHDAPSERWDEEWVGLSRESWERLERRERPFPGSLGGWDVYRIEMSQIAAARLGASEVLSAAAPAGKGK